MTVPGPSVRTIVVDDNAGTTKDITALVVGDLGGTGAIEEILTELTGPASTAPVFLPSGFSRTEDFSFTCQADVGGAIDTTAIFHVARGGSRTVTLTYAAGWTFASEFYITKVEPMVSPEKLALLKVTMKATGAATVT